MIVAGLSKGGFGGGIGMLATPLLALAVAPVKAAAILLPVLLVMDAIGLWSYRGYVSWPLVRSMLPGAFAGIGLGWATAAYVSDSLVRILIGVIAIGFGMAQVVADYRRVAPAREHFPRALFWSTVAGYTSFVAHAGGPPYQAYTLPLKMEKMIYAGTSIVFFAMVNAVKVAPYILLGQFGTENLALSAMMIPVAIGGVLAGIWLVRRISQTLFYRLTYAAMIVVGTRLIWDGIIGPA